MSQKRFCRSSGMSMIELVVVISIMGIIAAIVLPRLAPQGRASKGTACQMYKNNIEVQAQLWFRQKGSWPASDLSDIGANRAYFPEGLPACPVDGSGYTFNPTSQTVNGHAH